MKKINFILILLSVFALQTASAQIESALNNGRTTAATPVDQAATENNNPVGDVFNGSDQDVPGQVNEQQTVIEEDWMYPIDLDVLRDELFASSTPQQVAERINILTQQVQALTESNEELRRQNELIRASLNNCCSASAQGLTAEDAYLLQNAPNPFSEATEIRFYVPEGMQQVRLEVTDLIGTTIKSYEVDATGMNTIELDRAALAEGTYIYTLHVDGKIVDSRIMVLTR